VDGRGDNAAGATGPLHGLPQHRGKPDVIRCHSCESWNPDNKILLYPPLSNGDKKDGPSPFIKGE
jgi:hypothetical protein